jgi:hypothetical protein
MSLSAEQRAVVNEAKRIQRDVRKAATKARPKSLKADRGRERDNGFAQYIRRQPCEARAKGGCSGPVQHAHISYRVDGISNSFGRSVKNHDRHANPLCAEHHRIQGEVMGERPFWAWLGKDAYETAAAHYAAYRGDEPTAEKAGSSGYREAMNQKDPGQ